MRNEIILISFLICLSSGCSRNNRNVPSESEIRATEHALIGVNRIMVKKDHEKIRAYVRRNNLAMQESPTGLWYLTSGTPACTKAQKGQMATLRYTVSLLDGKLCYSSDSLGFKQFRIGQGGVEAGLEEGILMLCTGDKATFIMPPHLAYGLPGDGDRIPARSILVYHVELLKLDP
jgi:FKBP-type peptidyl-prolyl cis-trans isomerase